MSRNRPNTLDTPAASTPTTPSLALPGASQVHSQVHAQAALCISLARVLHHALADLNWPLLRFSDRGRLERVLTRLGGEIPLVWLAAAQPQVAQNKQSQPRAAQPFPAGNEQAD